MLPTITVDIGTTSVKLCLFDDAGTAVSMRRVSTPRVEDAWGEIYDLAVLDEMLHRFLRELDDGQRSTVRRIAVTGVGESGGLVRSDLTLASPMILWHDHRGAAVLPPLQSRRGAVYRTTGLPVNANYALSKAAWAVEHAESLGDAQWLNVSEYFAARMTGERWAEYSLASRTLALDLGTRSWSEEMCGLVGLETSIFPPLRAATEGSPISAGFAEASGLDPAVTVHVAGHDHMVGAVAAGVGVGDVLNSTGTTEGVLLLREEPSLDETSELAKLANGVSCTGAEFTLFASIPTGGSAFATLQSMLAMDRGQLLARVHRIHDVYLRGEVDLDRIPVVLPRFRGSPPPDKRAEDLGVVAGIRTDTTADEVVFACFLGMVLQLRDVLALFPVRPEVLTVIGPAVDNPLWLRLKADLLGTTLRVSSSSEVVSRGAQALASGVASVELASFVEIEPCESRRVELSAWVERIRPQWEHLKGTPA